jgi:predicted nucleic acid-binding protein
VSTAAAFIIDCSITMTWCFGDEATPASFAVLDRLERETALVPSHWYLEVTNVLAMAEKRKRITAAESDEFLTLLATLDIAVDEEPASTAFPKLLPLCRTHQLTSYDAAYLELAVRRQIPLASLDNDLCACARELGVIVLGK